MVLPTTLSKVKPVPDFKKLHEKLTQRNELRKGSKKPTTAIREFEFSSSRTKSEPRKNFGVKREPSLKRLRKDLCTVYTPVKSNGSVNKNSLQKIFFGISAMSGCKASDNCTYRSVKKKIPNNDCDSLISKTPININVTKTPMLARRIDGSSIKKVCTLPRRIKVNDSKSVPSRMLPQRVLIKSENYEYDASLNLRCDRSQENGLTPHVLKTQKLGSKIDKKNFIFEKVENSTSKSSPLSSRLNNSLQSPSRRLSNALQSLSPNIPSKRTPVAKYSVTQIADEKENKPYLKNIDKDSDQLNGKINFTEEKNSKEEGDVCKLKDFLIRDEELCEVKITDIDNCDDVDENKENMDPLKLTGKPMKQGVFCPPSRKPFVNLNNMYLPAEDELVHYADEGPEFDEDQHAIVSPEKAMGTSGVEQLILLPRSLMSDLDIPFLDNDGTDLKTAMQFEKPSNFLGRISEDCASDEPFSFDDGWQETSLEKLKNENARCLSAAEKLLNSVTKRPLSPVEDDDSIKAELDIVTSSPLSPVYRRFSMISIDSSSDESPKMTFTSIRNKMSGDPVVIPQVLRADHSPLVHPTLALLSSLRSPRQTTPRTLRHRAASHARLDEEVALYAEFKPDRDLGSSCRSINPVAESLLGGDEIHFIPIRRDSLLTPPSNLRRLSGSAFMPYTYL